MSEAARNAWALAVASVLGGEAAALAGDVLDIGGGAQLFARSIPDARLAPIAAPTAETNDFAAADLTSLAEASFDAAVCVGRLGFSDDPAAVVAAAARACKPCAPLLLVVAHSFEEDLAGARHAFTLRGLHEIVSAAGLDVAWAKAINPPNGGVLAHELSAFCLQSPRRLEMPDELLGWADALDERRPMLLACLGRKTGA